MQNILSDYRLLFFLVALLTYALVGAPTADNPGWIEGVIAVLLIASLGVGGFVQGFRFERDGKKQYWFLAAQVFLVFGLSLPILMAVINGVEPSDMLRDMIGFFFLITPLFFVVFLSEEEKFKPFLVLILIIGFTFSLRTLFPDMVLNIRGSELLYLANSPIVLFSSIFLIGAGGRKLFEHVTLKNTFFFFFCFVIGVICLLAMMQDTRRAAFFAVFASIIFMAIAGVIKSPIKLLLPALFLSGLLFLFHQDIVHIVDEIRLKTSRVGMNMRFQEWQAVWRVIHSDWISLLFGKGWGASFASPAVGGLQVTFTHSLLSAMLLKSGLIGLLLCLVYLVFMFEKLCRLVFSNPVAGIALFWPFIIPVLFYASYKSLDFGLLLTLIVIWSKPEKSANHQ